MSDTDWKARAERAEAECDDVHALLTSALSEPSIAADLSEPRVAAAMLRDERDEALARAEKAEAELERLRGELVPVGWEVLELSGCPRCGDDVVAEPAMDGDGFLDGNPARCQSCGLPGQVVVDDDGASFSADDREWEIKKESDRADKAEAERDKARVEEAVCCCGAKFSEHTVYDNHGAVEMNPPCPNQARVEEAVALLRECQEADYRASQCSLKLDHEVINAFIAACDARQPSRPSEAPCSAAASTSDTTLVEVRPVLEAKAVLAAFNAHSPLVLLRLQLDGKRLVVPRQAVDEHRFSGLNLSSFVEHKVANCTPYDIKGGAPAGATHYTDEPGEGVIYWQRGVTESFHLVSLSHWARGRNGDYGWQFQTGYQPHDKLKELA